MGLENVLDPHPSASRVEALAVVDLPFVAVERSGKHGALCSGGGLQKPTPRGASGRWCGTAPPNREGRKEERVRRAVG
jgi:hypothetical protein